MEIPVIESGLSRFQSPNINILHPEPLWTWAALILAAIATFSSLIRRSRRLLLRFRKARLVTIPLTPSSTCSFDDDDDLSCCSSSDDESDDVGIEEEEGEEEDDLIGDSEEDSGDPKGIQGQNGKLKYNFSWPEMSRDGGVVKFWDGLGLGLGRNGPSISLLDLGREQILGSFLRDSTEVPAVHVSSPGKVLAADTGGVKVWDSRVSGVSARATWQGEGPGKLARAWGGNGDEVYLGDDVGTLRVLDLRNVSSPSTETWWWGNGEGDAALNVGGADTDGLVSWCRSAARCLTCF